jgi:hypothetical protein
VILAYDKACDERGKRNAFKAKTVFNRKQEYYIIQELREALFSNEIPFSLT